MGNLFYPQLASGAVSQYPIKKTGAVRTVKNILPDGSMILYRDPNGSQCFWDLSYADLGPADMQALQDHFNSCGGPLRAFTFIDPTENMLVWSSDLRLPPWQCGSSLQLNPGVSDPDGGLEGFSVTNLGQANSEISQTLIVPAGYQYCLSVYARSSVGSQLTLTRRGSSAEESSTFTVDSTWKRLISSGRLEDSSVGFSAALSMGAGQQFELYGVQLEPQLAPSRYRRTSQSGGVYANVHWAVDELVRQAEAPDLYSTAFSLEATIRD